MEMLNRVTVNPTICGVELSFRGVLIPSNIPGWQQFYNSFMVATDFTKTYIGLGSVSFAEESKESPAGVSYAQKATIRFPSMDQNRAKRIVLMQKVKFIKLNLSNGQNIVLGRNDYAQNAFPKITTKTNHQIAEVSFETVSIFPSGFVSDLYSIGLPSLIPISL